MRFFFAAPLKPSLEGWKPRCREGICTCYADLETFLRGMETQEIAKYISPGRGALETFLRGMETQGSLGELELSAHPLKPSLEGWKPR